MRLTLAAITLTLFAGCGGGGAEGRQEVFTVSGVITQFNRPLADATVAFAASDPNGKQPTAIGRTDEDGRYELTTYDYGDGACEGKYKVTVSKVAMKKVTDSGDDGDHDSADEDMDVHSGGGKDGDDTQDLVPPQYSSFNDTPFNAEVKKSGENKFDFKIE